LDDDFSFDAIRAVEPIDKATLIELSHNRSTINCLRAFSGFPIEAFGNDVFVYAANRGELTQRDSVLVESD
jgi:hypothetical protein